MPSERVSQIAKPLAKVMTARVARKGGIRRRATERPLTAPTTRPVASMTSDRRRDREGVPGQEAPVGGHDPGPEDAGQGHHRGHREVDARR